MFDVVGCDVSLILYPAILYLDGFSNFLRHNVMILYEVVFVLDRFQQSLNRYSVWYLFNLSIF